MKTDRDKPGQTVTEAAVADVQRGLDQMVKLAMKFGQVDPTVEEITEFDRIAFGQAVRFEIDVCQPLPTLKQELNTIRAQLTNCLALLEQNVNANTRRRMVHSTLTSLRGELKYRRQERKQQKMRQPIQAS